MRYAVGDRVTLVDWTGRAVLRGTVVDVDAASRIGQPYLVQWDGPRGTVLEAEDVLLPYED
jgi:hypothetical protein